MRLGVDLGGTYIRAGLVDSGKIINKSKIKLKDIEKDILQCISKVMNKKVEFIGVGAPAPLDRAKGTMVNPRNLDVDDFKIVELLKDEFNVDVKLDNDANCFALAESELGAGKDVKNMIGVILGTGLGAGVIVDNKLYHGNSDCAGEIGKIKYQDSILENYVNASYLKEKFGRDTVDMKTKKYYKDYSKHLAFALSVLVNDFDPELIVLGGGLSNNFEYFIDSTKKGLKGLIYSQTFKKLRINKFGLEDSGILGASLIE